jgi:hypothetical protein
LAGFLAGLALADFLERSDAASFALPAGLAVVAGAVELLVMAGRPSAKCLLVRSDVLSLSA